MNGTDITYRRAAALLVPVLLLLAFLAAAMVPAALAQSPPAAPGAPGPVAAAAPAKHGGGEANLIVPDLGQASFVGMNGRTLLQLGLVVCVLGLVFGLVIYGQLKNLPVHKSMREISELIYETCKTYLITQGKFILILEALHRRHHGALLRLPPALRRLARGHHPAVQPGRHRRQLRRGLVRHPHQHLRQLAHRLREPRRQAVPRLRHPAQGRHEHRHAADQRRAVHHAAASCSSSPATMPARASSASPSASRSAPRRCASRAASSPRSPTSAPT